MCVRSQRFQSRSHLKAVLASGLALLDVAEQGGYINKPKMGWYEAIDPATGEVLSDKLLRAKEIIDNKDFWMMMFEKTDFKDYIHNQVQYG
jgi:hypothetical protein